MLEEEGFTETRASSTLTLSWEQQGWRALGNTLWKFSSSSEFERSHQQRFDSRAEQPCSSIF